jgi:hypothetical protein
MANNLDVIKEYLVAIGFAINQAQLNKTNKQINDLGNLVKGQSKSMAANVMAASRYMVTAISTVTAAITGMVTSQAKAQLEYQKFGTRMWMNTQAAKDFKIALDTLGESMEDIAWNPELRSQFTELNRLSKTLHTPYDAAGQFKGFRSILFEVKKFRVEMQYAMEWVSYYLLKNFAGPLAKIRESIQDIQKKIIINMPEWTKKVADFFTSILNVAGSAIRFIKDIFNTVLDFFQKSPQQVKLMLLAIGAAISLFMIGPAGRMAALFGYLLLLIEDFYGYLDGRKSSKTLAPMWKEFIKIYESFKDAGFADAIRTLVQGLADVVKGIFSVFTASSGKDANDTLAFWQAFAKAVSTIVEKIGQLLTLLGKSFTGSGTESADAFERLFGIESDKTKPKSGFRKFIETIFGGPSSWYAKDATVNKEIGALEPEAQSAMNTLGDWYKKQTGVNLRITSGKRSWGGHISGFKFDVADDELKKNVKGIRDRLIAYAKSIGLSVIDEYKNPTSRATGGHLDFNVRNYGNLSHLQSNYSAITRSNASNTTTVQVGDVIVKVEGTNASPQEIAAAVKAELQKKTGFDTTRRIRDMSSAPQ